ncbi:hypothetical protein FNF27_04300 [Cafeteria roenbergensis]|nr:hypothetical protein FNF27_04300 [Cafeteria roenbergensis]
MSQSEFEKHAVQAYSQAIAIVNQPTDEDDEPVQVTAVRPQDLELFWEYVFNPTGTLVDEEERAFLSERLQAFISREGLHSPELALPRGYLTRGNALHFMHQTNKDFYALKDRIQARKDAAELREEL